MHCFFGHYYFATFYEKCWNNDENNNKSNNYNINDNNSTCNNNICNNNNNNINNNSYNNNNNDFMIKFLLQVSIRINKHCLLNVHIFNILTTLTVWGHLKKCMSTPRNGVILIKVLKSSWENYITFSSSVVSSLRSSSLKHGFKKRCTVWHCYHHLVLFWTSDIFWSPCKRGNPWDDPSIRVICCALYGGCEKCIFFNLFHSKHIRFKCCEIWIR